jgi:hypothetical protein
MSDNWFERLRKRQHKQPANLRHSFYGHHEGVEWTETVPRSACYDDHTYLMLNGLHPADQCECDPTPRREFKAGRRLHRLRGIGWVSLPGTGCQL